MRQVIVAQYLILALLGIATVLTWVVFPSLIHEIDAIGLAMAVINRTFILSLFPLLIYLLLWGFMGKGLGITSLFWNDKPLTRFSAAAAVTFCLAVIATLMFLSYMIDPAKDNDKWAKGHTELVYFPYRTFMFMVGVPAVALVLAPAVRPLWFPFVPRSRLNPAVARPDHLADVTRNPLAWWHGVKVWAAGTLFGGFLFTLVILANEWLHSKELAILRYLYYDNISRFHLIYLIYATWAGLFFVIYAFFSFVDRAYERVSPPVAICALIAFLAFCYAAFDDLPKWADSAISNTTSHVPLVRCLIVVVLVVWYCAVNQDKFKLRFPNMAGYYDKPLDLGARVKEVYIKENQLVEWAPQTGDTGEAELAQDDEALNNWLRNVTEKEPDEVKQLPPHKRPKLALVAVSGGATRSALWTAVVLDRIERMIPEFRHHVRIITGASGGMLGAAYYVKHCRDDLEKTSASAEQTSPWVHEIPLESIGTVARYLALRDTWVAWLPRTQIFLPQDDRGIRLENDWKEIRFPIQCLLRLEKAGKIPSIILSPMIVEDGRRLLISNLDLWDMTVVKGSALTFDDPGILEYPYSLSALEFFRLFPEATCFTLATGVRMSASFPYVSPAVNLPTNPPRRVVDAGYYDNYGIQVATAWVQKNRVWLKDHTSGVVLVQIRDSISQKDRLEIAGAPGGFFACLACGFRFFTSPVDGAASARYASTMFRNDQDVWELSDLLDRNEPLYPDPNPTIPSKLDRAFFTTVIFENSAEVTFCRHTPGAWPGDGAIEPASGDVPLDWYLSDAEKEGLIDAIPEPACGSPWCEPECRRARIEELTKKVDETRGPDQNHWLKRLTKKVDETRGPDQNHWLKRLEQAKNYERLVVLRAWWGGPTPESCPNSDSAKAQSEANWFSRPDQRCGTTGCKMPPPTDGTWVVKSINLHSNENHGAQWEVRKIIIKGKQAVAKAQDEKKTIGSLIIKLNPDSKPQTIDSWFIKASCEKLEEDILKEPPVLGIYELSGDTLRVCWAPLENRNRPTEFASKAGSGHGLLVLKREKS
jgi:uncharacterized protein (TIGR03067 family)